jgi:hypothetical protein
MAPDPPASTGVSRAVIWIGLAAGTFLTVLAVTHGIRVPGLEVVLSVFMTWVLLMLLTVTGAELLRRHHRALAAHAARHGKRGALAAGRGARHGTGAAIAKAASRWQARQPGPPMFTTTRPGPDAGPAAGNPSRRPDGQPETEADARFFNLRGAGYTGPIDQDGNAVTPTETGGNPTMTDTPGSAAAAHASRIMPARRARHTAAKAGGSMPAEWGAVIARAADFEPDDDGELLGWMGDEVSGVAGYAEALVDLYESCTGGIGLDPVAMAALHDVADAAAHAAETMSGARRRFADHYELPREFAANGGLMTHDGRWVTGDGDA